MNTKISYIYEDGENFQITNTCVIDGEFSGKQINTIMKSLNKGQYFIPSQIGMPEIKFSDSTGPKNSWFKLSPDSFLKTNESPDINITPEELVARFCLRRHKWEEASNQFMLSDETAIATYKKTQSNAWMIVFFIMCIALFLSWFLPSECASIPLLIGLAGWAWFLIKGFN